jgi:Ca2+-binding RTX toxin-like protein
MSRRKRFLPAITVAIVLLTSTVVLAPTARATSICNLLLPEVRIDMGSSVRIVRDGDNILMDGSLCGTVTNTNLIYFYDNWGGTQSATISLMGGPFSPGLDTGSSPEIDIQYFATGNWIDTLTIGGTAAADQVRWGRLGGLLSANLNAAEVEGIDSDLQVVSGPATYVFPVVWGGGGGDYLSAAGGAGTGVVAVALVHFHGGAGADRLVGGNGKAYLFGDDGADLIWGGRRDDDRLDGGAGNDRVSGRDGNDRVNGSRGGDLLYGGAGNDVLNGGPGFDVCKGGPGNDKFVDCEKVVQ